LTAFLSAAASANAQKPPTAAEQGLIQVNSTLLDALRTGDSTALPGMLAEDLVYTDEAGVAQSKRQLLAGVARGYRVQLGDPQDVKAHIDGNVGLMNYQTKRTNDAGDTVLIRTDAVYVLRAGHWQLTSQRSSGATTGVGVTARTPTPVAVTPTPAPTTTLTTPSPTVPLISPTVVAPTKPSVPTGRVMTARAAGTFQADVKPLPAYNTSTDALLGRMSIDKQFHGDLEAVSKGEMLTAGNFTTGSAGYVAVERVTGTLGGRKGSFALQHTGTVNQGAQSLSVTVVPGSGTGELAGLSGSMNIIIESGKHSYTFDYSLPPRS
jgi:hypothetical protein